MSLQIIAGRASSGKTSYCYQEIHKALQDNIEGSLIMIVPEQFNLQTQQELANLIHPGLLRIEVQSFKNLALRIFNELGGPKEHPVDDLARLMILRKVVEEYKKQLRLFHKSGSQIGFMECLNRLITEFEQYRISEETLDGLYEKSEDSPALQHKLHDIKIIYTGFMEYIQEKFLTNEQTIDLLIDKVKTSKYLKNAHIWLDGFYGFSPQQYDLITELLKYASKVTITLPLESIPNEFAHLNENDPFFERKKAYQKLYTQAIENNIRVEPPILLQGQSLEDTKEGYKELAHLEREYLSYTSKPYTRVSKNIQINEYSNQYEEVEAVAKKMTSLVRDEGYRYKDIAVVAGNLPSYEGLIKSAFDEYSIPSFIDEKRSLSTHALVELIKGILEVINNNWSYNAVFRVLRTGLYPISVEEIDILENYVLAFGIKSKKIWTQEEDWQYENMEYYDEEEKKYIVEKEKQINEIRRRVTQHLMILQNKVKPKGKKSKPNIRQISIAIYEFLEDIKVEQALGIWIDESKGNRDLLLEKEHSQIWDRVKEIFERMVDILGDEVVPLMLYLKILESAFSSAKMGIIPPAKDQVIVGDIERSRFPNIRALFVIGTNDGMIPKLENGPEIFSDMDRIKIEDTGLEIAASSRKQAFESQFLIYLALTKPKEKLIISCALADEAGKSMRPSIMMYKLKKIFPKREAPNHDEFLENIYHPIPTFEYVGKRMREELDGREIGMDWKDAVSWYKNNEKWSRKIDTAIDYLFYTNQQHYLDANTAKMLYDNPLHSSVSKLETFRQCAFRYFVKYGIKAQERKILEFNAMDLGVLFHKALEEYPKRLEQDQVLWRDVEEEMRKSYVEEVVEEVVAKYGRSMSTTTMQNKYKIRQVKNMTQRAIGVLTEQLQKGEFNPKEYEVSFGNNNLPPIVIDIDEGRRMLLTGTIDRVDVYELQGKEGTTEYVKILDYKSGKKSFELLEVYYGLQLQLLLYLDAYLKNKENTLPAGVFYFHIDNPIIEYKAGMSEEKIEEERAKRFKLSGLVVKDGEVVRALDEEAKGKVIPASINNKKKEDDEDEFSKASSVATEEQFDDLRAYIVNMIRELGKEILNGKVSVKPYSLEGKQPCDYCDYKSICQFDTHQQDNQYHLLRKIDKEEIWENIGKVKGDEKNVDA